MHQPWMPGWQPRRLGREFLTRCLRTTAGGPLEKTHYLALALYAATREGIVDEGEFIVRTEVLRAALEHPPDGSTLRRRLIALQRAALVDIGRAGPARQYRVHARPDNRIVLGSRAAQLTDNGLASAIEADQITCALSQAVTGHWKPKTLLLALGALWRATGNERGSVRVGRAELRAILEWSHQGRLDRAKGALRDAGYIDWQHCGHELELAFLIDAYGHPRPEWRRRNRVIVQLGSATTAAASEPEPGPQPGPRIIIAPGPCAPSAPPAAPPAGAPAMTPRQLRTLAGILRDLYRIPHGEPVEKMHLASVPEDLAAELSRRAGGLKRTAAGEPRISLNTIPADVGAELIRRLGGPARNRTERQLRTRSLRERMLWGNRSTDPDDGDDKPRAPAEAANAALEAARQERAEESARQLGYVPTDNPDEPWVRKSRASVLGYDLIDGRACKRSPRDRADETPS